MSAEDPDTVPDSSAEDRETARVGASAAEVRPDAGTALVALVVPVSSSVTRCTIDTATRTIDSSGLDTIGRDLASGLHGRVD